MFHVKHFDVVVVGGGHAGCEAALAGARMGCSTLLITLDRKKIGEMSCNPSIGGVGKGQLVKEIDALGGEMGRNADYTGIQFKRLNTRKGSAVQSSRCQSDKRQYAARMQSAVASQPRLEILEGEVKELQVEQGRVVGVSVVSGAQGPIQIISGQVVITSGTFMKALMHCGSVQTEGGRYGERASVGLSDCLRDLGFSILRLKTGTPARLLRESIDFGRMEGQPGDEVPRKFSFWPSEIQLPQVLCYLTHTNEKTHAAIQRDLGKSPLFSGQIRGIGPRYCPSIEDKVVKFPDKQRHQLFFEPEALDSNWIYPNGISTSLPPEVQENFIRTIVGCEEVEIARYGYAVEYDCIDARQLRPTLESKLVEGLFVAGQINGTSGYEEAAAQGLLAGINATLRAQGKAPLVLKRSESYLGVMVDDLTQLGVTEPYRMFTSRAEYRLSLREDNADVRLSRIGHGIGLLSDEFFEIFESRCASRAKLRSFLQATQIKPGPELENAFAKVGSSKLEQTQTFEAVLKRPEISLDILAGLKEGAPIGEFDSTVRETAEIEIKYAGYINLQREEIERLERMRETDIPAAMTYESVVGLSTEIREKLSRRRPATLAEAALIPGMTPAALTALLFHLKHERNTSEFRPTL